MVAVTKIRVKFGPEGPVKTFQSFPGVDNCGNAKRIEHSIGEDIFISADQSKKRGPSKVLDEVQPKKKQKLDSALSTQCLTLIKFLLKHPVGGLFKEPVDPVKLEIPDYFSIITKPMDLGTIKTKLLKNMYSHVDEFAADVRLTISNALRYNPPDSWAHNLAMKLNELFEARWELLKKKKISKLSGIKVDCSIQSSSETSASSGRFSVELSKRAKEKSEKVPLWSKLVEGQRKMDTPAATPKALATKLKIKKLDRGLGFCSAVKIPSKGSAPTAACKCGSCGRYTCICLKSCNSSGSDVSSLTDCQLKNTSGSLASESDPNCNGSVSSRNEKNGCVSSQLDKPSNGALLDIELKTASPILPPLAPEKALRAAKLKDKFAETIIKAKRRIILQQSNKADLISIQIEKEQMERAQREEKARIEAEMRAAKIATRMRAQAELKQKRERQRLDLEKMEIDYDFEQNNHSKLEKDVVDVCGCSSRRVIQRTRLLFEEELGLVLRNDDCPELEKIESENFDAMRVDDLEEGEIL